MKKFTKMIVGVFCALLLVTGTAFAADTAVKATNAPVAVETAKAAPTPAFSYLWNQAPVTDQQWTFSLGGSGATGLKADSETAFGLNLSVGRTTQLVLPFEFGVRQGLGFSTEGSDSTILSTKVYADWTLLQYKRLELFAGGNIGPTYGNTPMLWTAAPETGLRYWLKKDVGIEGRLEFPFDIGDNSKFQNAMTYTVGLKVKF